MKKIFLFVAIVTVTFTSFSQSLGYNDLGRIFSEDNDYGTARFTAMSGAFGALGSDISSIGINPAGAAIATKSSFSFSLGNRNTDIGASYYGNTINSQDNFFSMPQIGAIFSFDSAYNTDWSRFALSFNYRLKKDFDGSFSSLGNSGEAYFNEHPEDTNNPRAQYNNGQEQAFTNITSGETSVFSLGFSAAHLKKLFVGGTVNIHQISFNQQTILEETNNDGNGNTLNAYNDQISSLESSGISLSFGFIYKLNPAFRFGLAYETPTWYNEVIEETNLNVFDPFDNTFNHYIGYTEISATNVDFDVDSGEEFNGNVFKLRTPSKITGSAAFIFEKQGLLSIDYSYKNYKNTQLSNGDFNAENQSFTNDYRGTHNINIGTEWRFDKMSLRGGYHFQQNPLKSALSSDNKKGFSAGLGYHFGSVKIDLAYTQSNNTGFYNIYNTSDINVNSIDLDTNTSRITGTISFNL